MKALVREPPQKALQRLRPAFKKDGVVTTANSSGINDGAAAVVVMSEEKGKELGVTPMATWVARSTGRRGSYHRWESDLLQQPERLWLRPEMNIDDFDLIEANEAFAAQSLAVARMILALTMTS